MRVIPYDGNIDLEDIESLSILIKAVPFEKGFAPAFVMISPTGDYDITMDEISCLMDGIEIAQLRVDELIDFMLQSQMSDDQTTFEIEFIEDDDDDEDNGESD